ncbi:3-dehydroquinate synthase [Croceiramulus getboli]|nr:3-dehydroquinate synthase [Flavobacteriaceae bacterium YJPT1-3]
MEAITSTDYQVTFNAPGYESLNDLLKEKDFSILFVLVDTNTHEHCLGLFLRQLETHTPIEVIEIDAGEEHKNLDTCIGVWEVLAELGADRKSAILNLGGGVVTDIGGFIASCYKRGIPFINIPTSLLAMVDASVGGKTGVDLGALKNQIGVINTPLLVQIDVDFLGTLPPEELRSGLAEMLKHGLIADADYWNQLQQLKELDGEDLAGLIHQSVVIKNEVVLQDIQEQNLRKTLNFGHTLGHAIESYCMEQEQKKRLLHGEAIAIGMILESYLSRKRSGLPEAQLHAITQTFLSYFEKETFLESDIDGIIELMKHDKKNERGQVRYVFLKEIGQAVIDQTASIDLVKEAFNYYAQA